MARTFTTTVRTSVSVIEEKSNRLSGLYLFERTYSRTGYGNGTTCVITRDDVRKTPPGVERLPLPYNADGQANAASVFVHAVVRQPAGGSLYRSTVDGTFGAYKATLPTVLPFDEGLIASRKIRMLKNIGDQKWSAGETLVEGKEAVSMIAKSARVLQRALMAASRKDWKRVAEYLGVAPRKLGTAADNVSAGWLAYHFGWAPVVSDLANAALFLGGHLDNEKLTLSASSHVETKTYTSSSYGPYTLVRNASAIPLSVKMTARKEMSLVWRGRVDYNVKISSLRELSRYGLIGLSTPWAVVPGSFLLDWLVPIGDYLAAVDSVAGLTFKSGYETRFARAKLLDIQGWPILGSTIGRLDEFVASPVGDGSSFRMARTGWKGLVAPLYLKDPLDLWKATTALALVKTSSAGIRASMDR